MKIQLDFDNKEIIILDSVPVSKIIQLLNDLGIPDDWKIRSEFKMIEKCSSSITTSPFINPPYKITYQ